MGLSNQIPSSRLIQPGVIANAGERPASPYEGMVVYQKDTNQTLVWDGSAWVMVHDTDQPPGMQLVAKTTMSSTSSQNVDGCFTDEFDNYVVKVNITSVSANCEIHLRMRTGTTTNANSEYAYAGAISYMGSSILTAQNSGGTRSEFVIATADTTYYPNMPLSIEIMQPKLAYRTAFFTNGFQPVNPQPYYRWLGGVMSVTTAYESFTLKTEGSQTMSGTIRVYGYRN